MGLRQKPQALLRASWLGYVIALSAVLGVSAVIGAGERYVPVGGLSYLYLTAVLATAVAFGRGPAIVASVAAVLAFDWLFVDPRHTFTVSDPQEWIMLFLFLLTAVTTSELAAAQRQRAQEAEQRQREAVVLYDVARLMSDPDFETALRAVAERLRLELGLSAVTVEVRDESGGAWRAATGENEAIALANRASQSPTMMLGEGVAPTGAQRGAPGRWVRVIPTHPPQQRPKASERVHFVPIRTDKRRAGSVYIVRAPGSPRFTASEDRLLSAVAAQISVAAERVRLRREATEAEILRRTDELKTALLNAVSHDLRTPLSSIITSAGSLRHRDVRWSEEDQQQFAETIEEEALRLNQIVGNLLDLSRMEGGSLRPDKGWYDVGGLIDDVLGRMAPLTARHHVTICVSPELPPILVDAVEIDQVLSNLVENATKYTPAGSSIQISARRIGDEVRIEVADDGPGIPADALPHLFEPFYRAESRGPRPKGTGLGLAVAKGLVEAHGGRIWAENRVGGGARFVFALPVGQAPDMTSEPEG